MARTTATASSEAPTSGQPLSYEELLDRAAELIDDGWCQRALAEDREGSPTEPWSASASRWSPLGALIAVWFADGARPEAFESAYTALALATGGRLEEWNAARWRTRRHVSSAFARARFYLPQARKPAQERAL